MFGTPPPHVPLRRVRSTVLVASYKMVQAMGRADDYLRALPPDHHATIVGAVAGTWIDVDIALAHYNACEALGLSNEAQVDVGRTVGAQVRGTFAGTVVRLSKEAGITPWSVVPAFPRLWTRGFEGSAVLGWKLGPKECRLDTVGNPLADIRYFRNALRGQCMGMLDLFCSRSYAHPRLAHFEPGTYSMRVQWT
jgi:hypothetical protein